METVPILSVSSLSGHEGRGVPPGRPSCCQSADAIPFPSSSSRTPSLFSVGILFSNFCYGISNGHPNKWCKKE